tara:strand:- start:53 stop:442 length:390 start_codon:yes stop_codon:yes gene_type:complete
MKASKKSYSDVNTSLYECTNQNSIKTKYISFYTDHVINQESVSITATLVTKEIVLNFLDSGATINYFFKNNDIVLTVIDYGILLSIDNDDQPQLDDSKIVGAKIINFFEQRPGVGKNSFRAAMSIIQVE